MLNGYMQRLCVLTVGERLHAARARDPAPHAFA